MNKDDLASFRSVGQSLKHVADAITESFTHARYHGSKSPLRPLDVCLDVELPNLRREGQGALADALRAYRSGLEGQDNG